MDPQLDRASSQVTRRPAGDEYDRKADLERPKLADQFEPSNSRANFSAPRTAASSSTTKTVPEISGIRRHSRSNSTNIRHFYSRTPREHLI